MKVESGFPAVNKLSPSYEKLVAAHEILWDVS